MKSIIVQQHPSVWLGICSYFFIQHCHWGALYFMLALGFCFFISIHILAVRSPLGDQQNLTKGHISERGFCMFHEKRAARKRTHSTYSISSHIRQEITQAERQITDPPKGEEDSVLLFIGAVGS